MAARLEKDFQKFEEREERFMFANCKKIDLLFKFDLFGCVVGFLGRRAKFLHEQIIKK